MEVDMENYSEDLRFQQLRFIGKILAGFTHEIKNYLAIIKESAGLIGDMVKIGKMSASDIPEYLDTIDAIEDQIEKATEKFTCLNRFSHRMDAQISTFNLNECLEELISLMSRFAKQKNVLLETDFSKAIPPIQSNPSMLQLLIFSFLEEKITGLEKNGRIMVKATLADKSVVIQIIQEGTLFESGPGTEPMFYQMRSDIATQLGGSISQDKETVITLPVSMS
jgi:signal transduction histidine kinase